MIAIDTAGHNNIGAVLQKMIDFEVALKSYQSYQN